MEADLDGRLPDDPNFTKGIRDRVMDDEIEGITAELQFRCQRNPQYDAYTFAADFFRLRHASLSYRVPNKFMPAQISAATFRFAVRNLFLITDYPGIDPEAIEDGSRQGPTTNTGDEFARMDYYNLPPYRSYLVSLTLTF